MFWEEKSWIKMWTESMIEETNFNLTHFTFYVEVFKANSRHSDILHINTSAHIIKK